MTESYLSLHAFARLRRSGRCRLHRRDFRELARMRALRALAERNA